jgi:hypothetical protein
MHALCLHVFALEQRQIRDHHGPIHYLHLELGLFPAKRPEILSLLLSPGVCEEPKTSNSGAVTLSSRNSDCRGGTILGWVHLMFAVATAVEIPPAAQISAIQTMRETV